MLGFLIKYGPYYGLDKREGWVLVPIGMFASALASLGRNGIEDFGLFVLGFVIGHVVVCAIKYAVLRWKAKHSVAK
jgi:hypothetical protein